MGTSDMNINKIKVEKFLLDKIRELEGYTYSDEYDEVEKHDCRIASEAYKEALCFVFNQCDNYSTCILNGVDVYEIDGKILFEHFSKHYPLKSSTDIIAVVKSLLFKLEDFPINGAKCQEFNTIEECIVYETIKYLKNHNYFLNRIYGVEGVELWKNLM